MDILAHALYGATVCSRSGLARNIKNSPITSRPWISDWPVWAAILFGVLPDLASIGIPLVHGWATNSAGTFYQDMDGHILVYYRYMHSLIVASAVSGILRLV